VRASRAWAWLALGLLAAPGARAAEQFPGQLDLAAGLVCYQNLDLECARVRLERALQAFSPERDPAYLQHVQAARLKLAEIFTAQDELSRAEAEFTALLLIDPGYELPPGEHPPKLVYVWSQARDRLAAQALRPGQGKLREEPLAERPPLHKPAAPAEAAPVPVPAPAPAPAAARPEPAPSPVQPGPAPPPEDPRAFRLGLTGGAVVLFGEDAEQVSSGLGAGLRFAWRPSGPISLAVAYDYAYHPTRDGGGALQSMALVLAGEVQLLAGPLAVRLGLALGAHTMGTRDRYDHWLALLQGRLALVWPADGAWGLGLEVNPSLVINQDESSFCLPLELLAEVRW